MYFGVLETQHLTIYAAGKTEHETLKTLRRRFDETVGPSFAFRSVHEMVDEYSPHVVNLLPGQSYVLA